MKMTTADVWPESRPTTKGIEPSDAQGESVCGIRYTMSTSCSFHAVGQVRWLTDRSALWLINQEMSE